MRSPSEGYRREDRYGFVQWQMLPEEGWEQYWDRIHVDADVKSRVFNYARFTLTKRGEVSVVGLPVHGIALLRGKPGTGKTSLVKGVAQRLAKEVVGGPVLFAEVDAHSLPSQMLGDSQRNTANLLERALPELADKGDPMVVLIDEVDAVATDRDRAGAGTDPVDVARATEAALQGLDHLAAAAPHMVIFGTSNFPQAIDPAFLSRLDLTIDIQLPGADQVLTILSDALDEIDADIDADARSHAAEAMIGLSGRDIRKAVFDAIVSRDAEFDAPLREKELMAAIDARRAL